MTQDILISFNLQAFLAKPEGRSEWEYGQDAGLDVPGREAAVSVSEVGQDQRPTTGRGLFAAVAPRLERAHREQRDYVRGLLDRLIRAESKVAHRELQLVRAQAVGDGDYIVRRMRKLKYAEADLARLRRAAERWGVRR